MSQVVKISDYSPVSSDWSPALQDALDDLATGHLGGEIFFDVETTLETAVVQTGSNMPLKLRGDGGSHIIIASPGVATTINLGSLSMLEIEGLLITGEGTEGAGAPVDAQNVFTLSNIIQTSIRNTKALGIKGQRVFQILGGNRVCFDTCDLSGNSASTIDMELAYSLMVRFCRFADFSYTAGGTYSKSPDGASWLKVSNPPSGIVGANSLMISVADSLFDEASNYGLEIEDYPQAHIERCGVNLKSIGFKFTNVRNPTLRDCAVGYNNVDLPMAQFNGCKYPVVIGLRTDNNMLAHPKRIEVTADFAANLKKLHCSDDIPAPTII